MRTSAAVGSPDLHRPAVALLRRAPAALLLVLATLVAELLDLVGTTHADAGASGAGHAGAEIVAGLAGLAVAGLAGHAIARRGGSVSGRSAPAARVATTTGALFLALVVHELVAIGLHAEHGAGPAELLTHLVGTVLPLALGLGVLVALVVGVRVVHHVVVAGRRVVAGCVVVLRDPVARLLVPPAAAEPAGLLASLRRAGRAPPVARG